MKILALDLGTTTGWATLEDSNLQLGSHRLATPQEIKRWGRERLDRTCDLRPFRLYAFLTARPTPDLLVFEDVEFQSYTKQCQLWSSLRTAVQFAVRKGFSTKAVLGTKIECVPVSTLKKFATGHGGATKEMMCSALCRKFPMRFCLPEGIAKREFVMENRPEKYALAQDDNAVDAAWLALWAQHNLGRMKI